MTGNLDSKNKDCLACRLISGFGVIGIGFYLFAQSKRRAKIEMNVLKLLGTGAFGVGTARLLNMDFLKSSKN